MIDDQLLPAAAHLTGGHAGDVLRPIIEATGGELLATTTSHVQYRPNSDLVVRYRCRIRRGSVEHSDTLLAATTVNGHFAGTVPIEAITDDGVPLSVGVWRWPFDPILTDLTTIVTPHLAGAELGELVGARPDLEVVAYRPTERAVIRCRGEGREVYVKVVAPSAVAAIASRHVALTDAGIPVPRLLATGTGWIAMDALPGTTLRERLKTGSTVLPSPERYRELLQRLATAELPAPSTVRSRLGDAAFHAAMLATVMPDARGRLDSVIERLEDSALGSRATGLVHGDLHEAQLIVDDEAVTGLLDIDDVGLGDVLEDIGTLVAHLRFRALTSGDERIDAYAERVRSALAADHDPADVDRQVAAALVGLATGPFRIQQPDWATTTNRVLEMVEHHLEQAGQPS